MKKLLAVAGVIALVFFRLSVHAANLDEIAENMMFETSVATDLYEETSVESEVVTSLEAGTVVFTTENVENNWCKISAGEYTGYIKVEYLKTIGDQDLINQEFEQSMNDNHKIYDKIQQLEEQKSRAGIRENMILVLTIVVLAVSDVLIKKKSSKATENQP